MAWTAGTASADESPLLHAAIALAPQIAAAGDEIEQARRIPPHIAEAMKLAMADGSAGWCAMIGCDSGYVSAFLDQDVARAMYSDIRVATGAAATPTGKATRVAGGYCVDGRFPFVSGCHHSEWAWLGCIVHEDGTPQTDAKGVPETRQCFLKLSRCEILDTWHTTGLRGTGSNDILVRDAFVPEEQTFSFQDPAVVKRPGPLHAFPYLFIAKGPAAALGYCPACGRCSDRNRNDETCPSLYGGRASRGAQGAAR